MDSHKAQSVLELSASLSLTYTSLGQAFSYSEFLYSAGGLMCFSKLDVCKGHTNGYWYRVLIVYVAQLWLPSHIQRGSFSPLCTWTCASLERIAPAPS